MSHLKRFFSANLFFLLFFEVFPFMDLHVQFASKKIAIIGTGYVGLISGAGLAQLGHKVICVDIDQEKIENLKKGSMPIYEEGLQDLIVKQCTNNNLSFTCNVQEAIALSDIIIITVGTPIGDDGAANLSALRGVITSLAQYTIGHKIVCIKSTVPVGTNNYVATFLQKNMLHGTCSIVSNPEFLREGSALKDFFGKNPIVLGGESQQALYELHQMYKPLIDAGQPLLVTDAVTAETIKYAWNSFLKLRISYINDIARFCCAVGADISGIIQGLALSNLHLPQEKVLPGPGIGGSCFPKDALALLSQSEKHNVTLPMVQATVVANKMHKQWIVDQVYQLLENNVSGKVVAILGLAFKAGTDDVRYSPALDALERLLTDGALVRAYDPKAMQNMKTLFPGATYCNSCYEAVKAADVILLLTEWDEFKEIDLSKVAMLVHQKNIVDGRNLWDPATLQQHGFVVRNLARKSSKQIGEYLQIKHHQNDPKNHHVLAR